MTDTVDIAGQVYEKGGHLLCHDDELEGRVLAFILYLVDPEWTEEDGGALELFDVDENGQPSRIANKIVPMWNTLAFFEVLLRISMMYLSTRSTQSLSIKCLRYLVIARVYL